MVACASAAGNFIPPFFVFPGERTRILEEQIQLGPTGSDFSVSPRLWMIGDVFIEWLEHFKLHARPSADNPVSNIYPGDLRHEKFQ